MKKAIFEKAASKKPKKDILSSCTLHMKLPAHIHMVCSLTQTFIYLWFRHFFANLDIVALLLSSPCRCLTIILYIYSAKKV